LHKVATGSSKTYTSDMMCGYPANFTGQRTFRDPGWMHDVLVSELDIDTTYFYCYGNSINGSIEGVVEWSEVSHFSTPPEVGTSGVTFVAFGDMGVDDTPKAMTTIDRVATNIDDIDFVLHFGDISYALGLGYVWEQFFRIVEPVARRIPYMITIGNHEYDHTSGGENDPSGAGLGFHPSWGNYGDDSHGECSVPMYHRFHMPDNGFHIYWYSFDYGNVHVVMISTEHNYTQGSPQYEWMEEDLNSVNRSITPFVVVTGHRPMYTSENCTDDPRARDFYVGLGMQRGFENLFLEYKVDLALWGHQHSYERTCPVYQQECNVEGTTHIVVGTAGAGLEPGSFSMGNAKEWSLFHWVDWGYLRVSTDDKNMNAQLISNEDGSVIEQINLKNRFSKF